MGVEPVRLLKEAEAAELFGVCERTLRKERQAGRLAYIRGPGRLIRYHPADLESYIESARTCQSIDAPAPRIGGIRSPSTVVDFEAARAERRSARRRK